MIKNENKKKVCIIGGGISGIISARHLKDVAEVIGFEGQDRLGGLWNNTYETDETCNPEKNKAFLEYYGCNWSSVYEGLKLNVFNFNCELKDFPMPKEWDLFCNNKQFYEYVCDYIKNFDLEKYFKKNTFVIDVSISDKFKKDKTQKQFIVKYSKTSNPKEISEEEFDHVLVANGHNSVPNMIHFEGEKDYDGVIMHSHNFRGFDGNFQKKTIAIVGMSFSGKDLLQFFFFRGIDVNLIKRIIIIGNNDTILKSTELKPYMEMNKLDFKLGSIKTLGKNKKVIFSDNSEEEIETIVLCTGYQIKFPLLENNDNLIST